MVYKNNSITIILGLSLGLASCDKSSDKTSEEAAAGVTDSERTAGIISGVNTAAQAVQSSGSLILPSATLTSAALASKFPISTYPQECNEEKSGWPVGFPANEEGGVGGSFAYNKAFVGCLLKQPDMRGETVIGALATIVSAMCSFGDQVKFDGVEHELTMNLSTDCYTEKTAELFQTVVGGTTAQAKVTGSLKDFDVNTTGKWDGSVRVKLSGSVDGKPAVFDTIYLFKLDDENKVYSFASTYGPDANQVITWPYAFGWALTVDAKNGKLIYEGRQQELDLPNNSEPGKTRHTRAVLTGTMTEDGAFTDLTDAQLLTANAFTGNGAISQTGFKSVVGSTAGGLYMRTFEAVNTDTSVFANYSVKHEGCISAGSSCTGNTGFAFSSASDLAFLMTSATTTPLKDWFINLVPLSFTKVTAEDYQY